LFRCCHRGMNSDQKTSSVQNVEPWMPERLSAVDGTRLHEIYHRPCSQAMLPSIPSGPLSASVRKASLKSDRAGSCVSRTREQRGVPGLHQRLVFPRLPGIINCHGPHLSGAVDGIPKEAEKEMEPRLKRISGTLLFVLAGVIIPAFTIPGPGGENEVPPFAPHKASSSVSSSDLDPAGRLVIRRLEGRVELDGWSDEAAWEGVEPLRHVQHAPNFGDPPSERTVVLAAFDDEYLYLAGRLYVSDPSFIQGPTKKRDTSTPSNDFFGILIDTFNDKENGLAFFTTPAGLRWDAAVSNDMVVEDPQRPAPHLQSFLLRGKHGHLEDRDGRKLQRGLRSGRDFPGVRG